MMQDVFVGVGVDVAKGGLAVHHPDHGARRIGDTSAAAAAAAAAAARSVAAACAKQPAPSKVDTSENPAVCERGLEVWARTARCDRRRARLPGGGWP
jgi:hypothetical protein